MDANQAKSPEKLSPAEALEIMRQRHSVRQYTDKPIPQDVRERLAATVEELNQQSGLHMQLFFDEPQCFATGMAHYGKFGGVKNYLAIVGKKTADLDEKAGYYGERIVILEQSLGLNSCWVGLTHGKSQAQIGAGEKQAIVIALGYGETQGATHKSKPMEELCSITGGVGGVGDAPDWFRTGMEAAMLAPTAMNQQKFLMSYDSTSGKLSARVNGRGFFSKVDLGIVKCDFELASGHSFDA